MGIGGNPSSARIAAPIIFSRSSRRNGWKKTSCALPHRFFAIRVGSLRADEYDRHTIIGPGQLVLKFQAGNAGQLNVDDQASRFWVDPEARNSSAEPKPSTAYPADSMQSPSACRTNTSSSMITILPLQLPCIAVQTNWPSPLRVLNPRCSNSTRVADRGLFYLGRTPGSGRDFELLGHPDQIGQRAGAHFAHHAAAVHFDRLLGGAKLAGDLLV